MTEHCNKLEFSDSSNCLKSCSRQRLKLSQVVLLTANPSSGRVQRQCHQHVVEGLSEFIGQWTNSACSTVQAQIGCTCLGTRPATARYLHTIHVTPAVSAAITYKTKRHTVYTRHLVPCHVITISMPHCLLPTQPNQWNPTWPCNRIWARHKTVLPSGCTMTACTATTPAAVEVLELIHQSCIDGCYVVRARPARSKADGIPKML